MHSLIFKPSICVACMQNRLIRGQIVKLVSYPNALWDNEQGVCRGGCGTHKSLSTLNVEPGYFLAHANQQAWFAMWESYAANVHVSFTLNVFIKSTLVLIISCIPCFLFSGFWKCALKTTGMLVKKLRRHFKRLHSKLNVI